MNKKIHELIKHELYDYQTQVNYSKKANSALFSIFGEFFQKIRVSDELMNEFSIEFIGYFVEGKLYNNLNISDESSSPNGASVLFKFKGDVVSFNLSSFRDGPDLIYRVCVSSVNELDINGHYLYKYLLYSALKVSKLKGSYFKMPRNSFSWEIKDIELRSFDDIYLPEETMDDLNLYVDIFKKKGKVLRYLNVGNPGTSKTESALVISNELIKEGVTIIKTPIDEVFHEKVELANVLAPALIILDDIDLSLGSRNSGSYSKLLGDFLDVLDGTDKLADDVGIIATTNAAHLLDIAAQRPGRFDKTLLFDKINEDNIKNIILKSLRLNFDDFSESDVNLFTNENIVNKFFEAKVSGSHIYNTIKMLKLRYETLELEDVTYVDVINSISHDLEILKKVKNKSFLSDTMDNDTGSSELGFSEGFSNGFTEKFDGLIEMPTRKLKRRR